MSSSSAPSMPLQEQRFEWKDKESSSCGWIFIDSVENSCSFGVLVMNDTCSQESVLAKAKEASLIAAVCVPQTGGGAAGIRFATSTTLEDRKPILMRFLRDHKALMSNVLVLMGETDAETLAIDEAARNIGLSGAVHALAKLFSIATKQENLGETFVHKLRCLSSRVNFCELAQAFGIGQIINCLEEITPLSQVPRIIIDGFGSLGSSVAYFVENLGIGRVVAILDGEEHISHDDGLPIAEILRSRVDRGRGLQKNQKGPNLLRFLDKLQMKRFNASNGTVLCVEADLIVLCTSQVQMNSAEDLDKILCTLGGSGAHFFFPAFSLSTDQDLLLNSDAGQKILDSHKCSYVPHWLCVAGRDQMIKSIAVIPFDFDSQSGRSCAIGSVLNSICLPVTRFTQEAYYTFAQKNILMFGHPACTKMARHKAKHPLSFEIVKNEDQRLPVEVFKNGERMQQNIEVMASEIKVLVHAILQDYDPVLVALFDDLLSYFVTQKLELIYLTEDTGDRPSKRTAIVVLEAIDHFFRACCNAKKELAKDIEGGGEATAIFNSQTIFFEYVKKQRTEKFSEKEESTDEVIHRLKIPFSKETVFLLSEHVVESNKILVVLDVMLTQAPEHEELGVESEAPPAIGSQPDKSAEKHPRELGNALAGVLASVAELLELPKILQFGLQAFLVLGGKYFLGHKLDNQMEPSIYEDIETVRSAIKIVEAARNVTFGEADNIEERVVKKLAKIMPSIPFASDLPKKLVELLMLVVGNADMTCELLYIYLLPALMKKANDDEKRKE